MSAAPAASDAAPYGEEAGADDRSSDGVLDSGFLAEVGAQIRARRGQHGLTVQQLADRTQISRRLLTQIELGQANPSLVTITRIARQLGADTTDLLGGPPAESAIELRGADRRLLVWSSGAGSAAHLLIATAGVRSADLWHFHLVPGDTYYGQADPPGSQELFHVLAGVLVLTADTEHVEVPTGSSARLRSDRPYTYAAAGQDPVGFIRTVALAR